MVMGSKYLLNKWLLYFVLPRMHWLCLVVYRLTVINILVAVTVVTMQLLIALRSHLYISLRSTLNS